MLSWMESARFLKDLLNVPRRSGLSIQWRSSFIEILTTCMRPVDVKYIRSVA